MLNPYSNSDKIEAIVTILFSSELPGSPPPLTQPGGPYFNFDPASISGALIWGMVAGIATSAFLLLCSLIFTKIIVPWWEDFIYKGVDLSGVWLYSQTLSGIRYDYMMTLTQRAHRIEGMMNLTKTGAPAGPRGDYVQGFDISGETWESFVTLNMKSTDRRSLAFATSLLQIENRGRSLIGQLAYRSSGGGKVGSEEVQWQRG
jgi:hypothetical protein